MRVRGQAATGVRELLAEPVELVGAEPTLEEGPGVHAGGRVPLEVHLVATAGVVLAAEEVVEADLVQRRDRRVRRDVAADADARPLRARHHDRGVPPDPRAVAALDDLVTGEVRLVVDADRVDVRRVERCRDRDVALARPLQQVQQDVARSRSALVVDQAVERLDPFTGLDRVDVRDLAQQAVDERPSLVSRSHLRSSPFLRSVGPVGHDAVVNPNRRVVHRLVRSSAHCRTSPGRKSHRRRSVTRDVRDNDACDTESTTTP